MCESRSERCAPTMHSKLWQQAYNAQKYGPDNYNRMIRTTGPGGDWKVPTQLLAYCAVDQYGPVSQARIHTCI
jgi:hypothetical protein